jgi:hypothetical protein
MINNTITKNSQIKSDLLIAKQDIPQLAVNKNGWERENKVCGQINTFAVS